MDWVGFPVSTDEYGRYGGSDGFGDSDGSGGVGGSGESVGSGWFGGLAGLAVPIGHACQGGFVRYGGCTRNGENDELGRLPTPPNMDRNYPSKTRLKPRIEKADIHFSNKSNKPFDIW